jgi:flotillin
MLSLMWQATPDSWVMWVVLTVVAVFFVGFWIYASRYAKVAPNAVMVISGGRGQRVGRGGDRVRFRIIKGGGTFVLPIFERVDFLSLELMTIDVRTPEVYTQQGVPIIVDGVAQIKIRSDDVSIATAVEQFLSKDQKTIAGIAQQTLEGHLRAILGTMTIEEIYKNRDAFATRVQEVAAGDMANMGLGIISFTIRDVRDSQGYLEALGRGRIAEVKRDATIAESEATRDATIKAAQFRQEGETAKFEAETRIASANRDYEIEVASYNKDVNTQKAESDLAYELQKNKSMLAVREGQVNVEIVEKNRRIELENLEIQRKQRELEATVQRPADAKKYEIERVAEAERFRLENIAEGQSKSTRMTGLAAAEVTQATGAAEAEASRARGLAEAEVIKQKGLAEAAGQLSKAEAWQQYNEAAIAQLLIEKLPEIARAIAEPLTRIDKVTIVSTGQGQGTGASKLTQDIGQVMAELPPLVHALSGIDLNALMQRLPELATRMDRDAGGAQVINAPVASAPQTDRPGRIVNAMGAQGNRQGGKPAQAPANPTSAAPTAESPGKNGSGES